MLKKSFMLIMIALFILSCQSGKEDIKKFSADFTALTQKFKEKRTKVNTRDEYITYKEEKRLAFEDLLKKYEKSPNVDEIEILRSRVLVELRKLEDAEKKIDKIIAGKSGPVTEARMVKVNLLIKKKEYKEAYDIFKEIEPEIKNPDDLFNAYHYFALEIDDNAVKKEYAGKFLHAENMPESFVNFKYEVYSGLAAVATVEGDFDKARKILEEGIADTTNERHRVVLEKQLGQMDFIGKECFPLTAKTWLNSPALELEKLRGKVVILFFWAPWCPYCRTITPVLQESYNKYADQGLEIIGGTRYYGSYSDDEVDIGSVSKEEELENIQNYLVRKKIPFPVVVADDKSDMDKYKIPGLPTMVFITKKGNIEFFKIGAGDEAFIKNKIKTLLAET